MKDPWWRKLRKSLGFWTKKDIRIAGSIPKIVEAVVGYYAKAWDACDVAQREISKELQSRGIPHKLVTWRGKKPEKVMGNLTIIPGHGAVFGDMRDGSVWIGDNLGYRVHSNIDAAMHWLEKKLCYDMDLLHVMEPVQWR